MVIIIKKFEIFSSPQKLLAHEGKIVSKGYRNIVGDGIFSNNAQKGLFII
jgi:hypothetical protein